MSVGLVIVTHGESGADLRAEAEFILGESLEALRAVPFNHSAGQREEIYQIHSAIAAADSGDGVLVLTDMFGSTPANIANGLKSDSGLQVLAGVNLSMLVRVLNYPALPLPDMAEKALSGGRDGVLICPIRGEDRDT